MAAGVLVFSWLLIVRPAIKTIAEDAVQDAVQAPLEKAQGQIANLARKVGSTPPPPLVKGTSRSEGTAAKEVPIDGRLEVGGNTSFKVPDGQTLSVTDLVLGNPEGDSGKLTILRDSNPMLVVRLDNFRDLDYHFVSPITFEGGQTLVLSVGCANPDETPCSAAVFYGGTVRKS